MVNKYLQLIYLILYKIKRKLKFGKFIEHFFVEILFFSFLFFKNFKKYKSTKPTILICRSKYMKDKNVESQSRIFLFDTLIKFNVDVFEFYCDLESKRMGYLNKLIKKIIYIDPDIILFNEYSDNIINGFYHPSQNVLKKLKPYVKSKFLILWYDTCSDSFFYKNLKPKFDIFDFHVIVENPEKKLIGIKEHEFKKLLFLYPIPNPNELYKIDVPKNIDVSFLGQIDSYREYRKIFIEKLNKEKLSNSDLDIYISTNQKANFLTHIEYANILNRSKISINFSKSVHFDQLKGRIWEILLSGSLLLETKNTQTDTLLVDGKEYVSFTNEENMINKIRYYLMNDVEREKIALNGYNKARKIFEKQNFWENIFISSGKKITKI
ncbi:MAG: hypothetical protein CMP34_02950 [Rickettsiales bacterium]|nr:hypothetical protein [Rickettsiales bacterium]